jgi:DNA repair exonuclease SbcCD nuclease subunit
VKTSPKYVLIGDVHLSDRAPSSCTDSYLEDLFTLLNQVARQCEQEKADALIIAGDLFHSKVPGRTSHNTIRALIELLGSIKCPVLVVVGNHDIQNDRLESAESTQPLSVLVAAGVVQLLDGWWADSPVYGVPWQQEWSPETIKEACLGFTLRKPRSFTSLVVTHAPIYPPGKEPTYPGAECTPVSWWSGALDEHACVFYGHIHEPHGVYEAEGLRLCNNGALSRGSLDEYNLGRPVIATVFEDGEFRAVELETRPASEVFRLKEKRKEVTSTAKLDEFLGTIGTTTLDSMSVEGVIADINRRDIDPAVKRVAVGLVEESYAEAGK